MDSQQPLDFLKKGLHVTLGATTALIESVQDPLKREENIAQLNLGFDELTHIWEEKGAVTETEARQFIDTVISSSVGSGTSSYSSTSDANSSRHFDGQVAAEIQELTQQIAAIRTELSGPKSINLE